MTSEHVAFVGIGSNSEEREQAILVTISKLNHVVPRLAVSQIYETAPQGSSRQTSYLNCVARILWRASPRSLLYVLQQVENVLGRRRIVRWGARVIDLDLLLFSDVIVHDRTLALPHPSMHRRVFVLLPLLELAPDARSPQTGVPYRRYLSRTPPVGWRVVAVPQRTRNDTWVMAAA